MPLEGSDNQAPSSSRVPKVVAIDPGVRTFGTCYVGPEGKAYEWGRNDIGRIYRICHYLDDLQSRWGQPGVKARQRYRMRRAAARMRERIRNLVDEVHKKMALWLVKKHDLVLLPKFDTSNMVLRRSGRRIPSKTARAMLGWAHYRFRMRLLNKAREYPHCRVEIVDEHYTSKTCGRCGRIHQKLGGKKVFRCPRCRLEADRDIHAARNVLLCFLAHQDIIVAKGRELYGQSPAALGPTPVNASTHCGAFVQDLQNVQV